MFNVVSGNNNASPKEAHIQWRGNRLLNSGNSNGITTVDGGGGEEEGAGGTEGTGSTGPDQLEGSGTIENDTIHLKRRVGLISGVALIVGTMIGKFSFHYLQI